MPGGENFSSESSQMSSGEKSSSTSGNTNASKVTAARSRSVLDFENERSLRAALKDCSRRGSFPTAVNDDAAVATSDVQDDVFADAKRKDCGDDCMQNFTVGNGHDEDTKITPGYCDMFDEDEDGDLSTSDAEILPPTSDWVTENLDMKTSIAQTLDCELQRLQVLKSYLILDTDKEPSFERITALAARIFAVPIALVSLVDLGRQWFMSNRGLNDVRETSRKLAFCAHAIMSELDLLIIPDATKDLRFALNPLVTGPPNIRFYAGSPLICPEGHKLGTLCVIDTQTRPHGLSLEEKQNLRELADMVVDTMVQRRRDKLRLAQDKSKIIACTAHDLLTPLSGVQLSLSLLLEDENLKGSLDVHQLDLVQTAGSCSDVMSRICHQAIKNFRADSVSGETNSVYEQGDEMRLPGESKRHSDGKYCGTLTAEPCSGKTINISSLVNNLKMVIKPFPKLVPLAISVDPDVPACIVSDDLKIFRSAVNFMTNAFKKTKKGCVRLNIYVGTKGRGSQRRHNSINQRPPASCAPEVVDSLAKKPRRGKLMIVFRCEDTGPGVAPEMWPKLFMPFRDNEIVDDPDKLFSRTGNSGLGLFSVANNIDSLGGEYGFRPRRGECDTSGAIFWFSVPLVVPNQQTTSSRKMKPIESTGEQPLATVSQADAFECREDKGEKKIKILSVSNTDDDGSEKIYNVVMNSFNDAAADEKYGPGDGDLCPNRAINKKNNDKIEGEMSSAMMKSTSGQRVRRALVIDDSIVIRKTIDRALDNIGYEVTTASNGMEGLKALQSTLFDVVLCDFLMPIMDGLDCVQQYRTWETSNRPWFAQYIIGISAHASENDVKKGMDVGMNCFMAKPVPLRALKELEKIAEIEAASKALDDALCIADQEPGQFSDDDDLMNIVTSKQDFEGRSYPLTLTSTSTSVPACLIAEDSRTVSKLLVRAVDSRGWKTCHVANGEAALQKMKSRNWDAVFLDDDMPKLSGTECISEFREWEVLNRVTFQNNVLLLSGNFSAEDGENAVYPSGFDGCLGKPVELHVLYRLLDSIAKKGGECNSSDIMMR